MHDKYVRTNQPSDESRARALEDEERAHERTIIERDCYREWADMLAEGIANYFGHDIGEHSNLNNPWKEACEMIEMATVHKENEAAQKPEPVSGETSAAVDLAQLRNDVFNGSGLLSSAAEKLMDRILDYITAHYNITPKVK